MTVLAADVGGTNCRLALAGPDGALYSVVRYSNDDFATFDAVLARYLADHPEAAPSACAIAVAGPVTSEHARLTNRDWTFDVGALSRSLGGARVMLLNDLAALGHALPGLGTGQIRILRPATAAGPSNRQAVVVGLGTGVNICLVKTTAQGLTVIEAEQGHASLPSAIAAVLADVLGPDKARAFATVEHLFAGRGLAHLHRALTGQDLATHRIVSEPAGAATAALAARLVGLLAREMVFQYLPLDGIRFAGGVARGVLAAAEPEFQAALSQPGAFSDLIARVEIGIITEDAAALTGLARLALGLS